MHVHVGKNETFNKDSEVVQAKYVWWETSEVWKWGNGKEEIYLNSW